MDTKFIKLQSRMYMYNKKNIKMFCFCFLPPQFIIKSKINSAVGQSPGTIFISYINDTMEYAHCQFSLIF
jgi:hypothetical protein